jgi:predicted short-subunit dehydrogenase-like oxidoreductase (DUF2520 family)
MTRLIVGDGAVARALSGALSRMGEPPLRWSRAAGGVVPDAEVVVLAVRDEAIAEVAKMIVAALPAPPVLLHCAGALGGGEPFGGLSIRGAALLHPLRAFSGGAEDVSLAQTVFGIEGDERGRDEALAIVKTVGGVPLVLDGQQLAKYHAAAALVSNATVGLVDAGSELLVEAGLERKPATAALTALLSSTVKNLEELGLPTALTGPISRGDVAVVARHLSVLSGPARELYRATALRVLKVAQKKGRATPEALQKIEDLLGA